MCNVNTRDAYTNLIVIVSTTFRLTGLFSRVITFDSSAMYFNVHSIYVSTVMIYMFMVPCWQVISKISHTIRECMIFGCYYDRGLPWEISEFVYACTQSYVHT